MSRPRIPDIVQMSSTQGLNIAQMFGIEGLDISIMSGLLGLDISIMSSLPRLDATSSILFYFYHPFTLQLFTISHL